MANKIRIKMEIKKFDSENTSLTKQFLGRCDAHFQRNLQNQLETVHDESEIPEKCPSLLRGMQCASCQVA